MNARTHDFHELLAAIDQIKSVQGRGGYFNRAGRRSGGEKHFDISPLVGAIAEAVFKLRSKDLSIQCFEQRHRDCTGKGPFFGHKCECKCHTKSTP